MGSVPLTERQTSPSELGPENLDLSSFNGSYRMWRRFVHFLCYIFLDYGLQCFDAVGWAAGRASGL